MTTQTLELLGPHARRPHRPRLAAAGLTLAALGNILLLIRPCEFFFNTFQPHREPLWAFDERMLTDAGGSILAALGVVLLAVANLEANAFRLPIRKLLGLTAIIASLITCAANAATWFVTAFFDEPGVDGKGAAEFFQRVYLPLNFAIPAITCLVTLFGLIYALQLSLWFRKRNAVIGSAVLLGLELLFQVADFSLLLLYQLAGTHMRHTPDMANIMNVGFPAALMLTQLAVTVFLLILATRLARIRNKS